MERRNNYNQNYGNQGGYNNNKGYQNPEGGRFNQEKGYGGDYNQGGYNQNRAGPPRDNYQNKGGDFGNRPRYGGNQENQVARRTPNQAGKVELVTNQFMMKIGSDLSVFIYEVQIRPEAINDSFLTHAIFKICRKKLEMLLGIYVISGNNIFTTSDIPESFKMQVEYKG